MRTDHFYCGFATAAKPTRNTRSSKSSCLSSDLHDWWNTTIIVDLMSFSWWNVIWLHCEPLLHFNGKCTGKASCHEEKLPIWFISPDIHQPNRYKTKLLGVGREDYWSRISQYVPCKCDAIFVKPTGFQIVYNLIPLNFVKTKSTSHKRPCY